MFKGINDQDLAKLVTCKEKILWDEKEINIYNVRLKEKKLMLMLLFWIME